MHRGMESQRRFAVITVLLFFSFFLFQLTGGGLDQTIKKKKKRLTSWLMYTQLLGLDCNLGSIMKARFQKAIKECLSVCILTCICVSHVPRLQQKELIDLPVPMSLCCTDRKEQCLFILLHEICTSFALTLIDSESCRSYAIHA